MLTATLSQQLTRNFGAIVGVSPGPEVARGGLGAPGVGVALPGAFILASLAMDSVRFRNGPGRIPPSPGSLKQELRGAE